MSRSAKKILVIFHDASRTGASIVLLRLLNKLAQLRTLEVHVCLPREGAIIALFDKTIHTHLLDRDQRWNAQKSIFGRITDKVSPKRISNPLLETIEKVNPSLCYLNTLVADKQVRLIRKNTQHRIIWHIHELPLAAGVIGVTEPALHLADLLIANSLETKQFLVSKGADDSKVTEVPPSIDEAFFQAQSRSQSNSVDHSFTVGCVGTAMTRKGFEIFLHTAFRFKQRFGAGNIRFVWVGSTLPMRGEAEWDVDKAGLGDMVSLVNDNRNISKILLDFDIYFCPSKEESFGLAPMEAMATGCPVIAMSGSGAIERLTHEAGGEIVPYFDVERIVDVIDQYRNDSDLLRQKGASAKSFAEAFTTDTVFQQWLEQLTATLD